MNRLGAAPRRIAAALGLAAILAAAPAAADPSPAVKAELARLEAASQRARLSADSDAELAAAERLLAYQLATLGPKDASYEDTLLLLSFGLVPRSRRGEALGRVVGILDRALGPASPRLAAGLQILGDNLLVGGDHDLAEPLLVRALGVAEKDDASSVNARELRRTLVDLYAASGDAAAAAAMEARVLAADGTGDRLLMAVGREAVKRRVMDDQRDTLDQAVSLHTRAFPASPEAARLAFGVVLERKGKVLDTVADSLATARELSDDSTSARVQRLAVIASQLSVRLTRGGASSAEVARLMDERDSLEVQVNAAAWEQHRSGEPVTLERVAAALPADAALVEIIGYRAYAFGKRKVVVPSAGGETDLAMTTEGRWKPRRYAAYVLRPGGAIASADLGEAAAVDEAVRALRTALQDARLDPKPAARALDQKVMDPLRPLLGGARRIFVSPDGSLSLVPFGALVDKDGRYLLEDTSFVYLTSGRDLGRARRGPGRGEGVVLFADPDFGPATTAAAQRGLVDFSKLEFPRLAGTRQEAERIARTVAGAELVTGADATEARLKATRRPLLLHLATHGFFLPGDPKAPSPAGGPLRPDNPLLRAGIAFARANEPPRGDEDGLLTALEASALDLEGTALVVLSACSTGVGDVSAGEGVYGMRRAFEVAGAESLVMSLWDVSDPATRDLMGAYYERLAAGEGRAEALRRAALALRADPARSHPYFWAAFIASGSDAPLPLKPVTPAPSKVPPIAPPPRGCACDQGGADGGEAALIALALGALGLGRKRARARG